MFPRDHAPLGLRTKNNWQDKTKNTDRGGRVSAPGESICTSRCLSVTNLSVVLKETQKSGVFTADWGLPIVPYIGKSTEKTWKSGIKSTSPAMGKQKTTLLWNNEQRELSSVSLGISLVGSNAGRSWSTSWTSMSEKGSCGARAKVGRWCRKENVLGLVSQEQVLKQLCGEKTRGEEPWDAGMAFGIIPPHPRPVCC